MFAAALLRDAVGDQVEPYVRDRIDYKTANQRVDTQIMFNSQEAFKQAMEHMFGDPNKERKAVQELIVLKQTDLLTKYVATFRQLLGKAGQEENDSTIMQLYNGLNDQIKDRMLLRTEGRPTKFEEMI